MGQAAKQTARTHFGASQAVATPERTPPPDIAYVCPLQIGRQIEAIDFARSAIPAMTRVAAMTRETLFPPGANFSTAT